MNDQRRECKLILLSIACGIAFASMIGCAPPPSEFPPAPAMQYGPPVSAPTIDYESVAGFDPLTEKMIEEREAINELQWQVDRLSRQVRDMSQIVYGIRELRVGETPPDYLQNPSCDCEDCDCVDCDCGTENREKIEP
ncbi:MAG: hypothetical protein AAGJ40_09745 [Planctomycetota bacterium]